MLRALHPPFTSLAGLGVLLLTACGSDRTWPSGPPAVAVGQIAFVSNRDGNYEIYLLHADGSGLRNLTSNAALDLDPTWSTDGAKIAFRSERDGNYEIYVMNADGSGLRNLSPNYPSGAYAPAWSPDGTRMLFQLQTCADDCGGIGVINADGSGLHNLTNRNDFGPAWSPDGTKIAFTSHRDGNYEVYVMNADGSGATNLTTNPAYDNSAAWRPRQGSLEGDGSPNAFSRPSRAPRGDGSHRRQHRDSQMTSMSRLP